MDSVGNHPVYHTPGDGSHMQVLNTASAKIKKRKNDLHVSANVCDTNVLVPFQKSNRNRCKSRRSSRASKNNDENLNNKLDVVRPDHPELLSNIVKKERKAPNEYIHVRARRGHATDSHSLAERVRRQKISHRMNILQNLVPGCSKIKKRALVLEEIINYVQSLQNQVKILSMKIASVVPLRGFDHQIIDHSSKEILPVKATADPIIAYSTACNYVDHTHIVAQKYQMAGKITEECSTK